MATLAADVAALVLLSCCKVSLSRRRKCGGGVILSIISFFSIDLDAIVIHIFRMVFY